MNAVKRITGTYRIKTVQKFFALSTLHLYRDPQACNVATEYMIKQFSNDLKIGRVLLLTQRGIQARKENYGTIQTSEAVGKESFHRASLISAGC